MNAFNAPQRPSSRRLTGLAWLLVGALVAGCATLPARDSSVEAATPKTASMASQVQALGAGLRFLNPPVPDGAEAPEAGAEYVYARTYSSNSRNSPVGIELWVFGEKGEPIHLKHESYLREVYASIYGWDPAAWKALLGEAPDGAKVLREKSDFFWESLAQQMAERVLSEPHTPAIYRLGPGCAEAKAEGCLDPGIEEANRVVVRTFLDARRDPMNPVTRSITYDVQRGHLTDPELFFELQVPNGLKVAGPHQELLDFRPHVAGNQDAVGDIRIWAHLPRGRRARVVNTDYPDYNLVFVPLRHLVAQREVEDPKRPASGANYPSRAALIEDIGALMTRLRTAEQGKRVAEELRPFLTAKYYYMFESGGQGLAGYRDYILGEAAGVARGLSPDFGRIELLLDGEPVASFSEQP